MKENIEENNAGVNKPVVKKDDMSDSIDSLIKFFSSLKLAISMFVLLTIGSILGTVIEQNKTPEEYIKWIDSFTNARGEQLYPVLKLLGLNDLYHTWWYVALLLILTINVTTCFLRRSPKVWRTVHNEKIYVSLGFIKNLKNYTSHSVTLTGVKATEAVSSFLRKTRYGVKTVDRPDEISLYASKGVIGRLGSHITHISMLFIMVGGLMGSLFEQKDFGAFLEGQTYHVKEGDFEVRVDKFWMEYYDDGNVKDFFSKLTIFDEGKEVMTKQIQVNDPLEYNGVWLYQSSYGDSWNKIVNAKIAILNAETDEVVDEIWLEWRKEYSVSDLGITLKLEQFVSDFAYDYEKDMVYASAADHKNPAVGVVIQENGGEKIAPWIFYNYPNMYEKMEGMKYKYQVVGYTPHKYTGLQIAKDPGVPIVWLGFGLMTIGMFISSFIFHRRIWVKILEDKETGTFTIHLGGNTNKNAFDFQRELDTIIFEIKKISSTEGNT